MKPKIPIIRDKTTTTGDGLTRRERKLGKIIRHQVNYTKKEWKELKKKEAEERA